MGTQRVSISISSQSAMDSRDDGSVNLRVEDDASGECLVDVTIPAGRWWRLCQGSTQHHDALVSPHLDRLGKKLETTVLPIPDPLEGDTEKDTGRDIYHALEARLDLLEAGWHDYQEHRVRRTNKGHEAILRRWVEVPADA